MREWHCVTEQEYHEAKAKGLQVRASATMNERQYSELRKLFDFTTEPGSYFAFATLDELGRDDIDNGTMWAVQASIDMQQVARKPSFLQGAGLTMSETPPRYDTQGPFIVWLDYGFDGWSPRSFDTLEQAIDSDKLDSPFVITKSIRLKTVEME